LFPQLFFTFLTLILLPGPIQGLRISGKDAQMKMHPAAKCLLRVMSGLLILALLQVRAWLCHQIFRRKALLTIQDWMVVSKQWTTDMWITLEANWADFHHSPCESLLP
jgi:hypothetical protein